MTKTTEKKQCAECRGRGWNVGECHPAETCGICDGTGLVAPPATERPKECDECGEVFTAGQTVCTKSAAPPERPRMTEEPELTRDQIDAAKARVFIPTLFDLAEEAQNTACVMAFFLGRAEADRDALMELLHELKHDYGEGSALRTAIDAALAP